MGFHKTGCRGHNSLRPDSACDAAQRRNELWPLHHRHNPAKLLNSIIGAPGKRGNR